MAYVLSSILPMDICLHVIQNEINRRNVITDEQKEQEAQEESEYHRERMEALQLDVYHLDQGTGIYEMLYTPTGSLRQDYDEEDVRSYIDKLVVYHDNKSRHDYQPLDDGQIIDYDEQYEIDQEVQYGELDNSYQYEQLTN